MKKLSIYVKTVALLVCLLFLVGCGGDAMDEDNIVLITERFFVQQTQEIWLNPQGYIGRAIRYQGMFFSQDWEGETFHMVVRFADDCCGGGGAIGFEVYIGDIEPFADDTWVEVTGILEFHDDGDGEILRLNVVSLIEMEERGASTVQI